MESKDIHNHNLSHSQYPPAMLPELPQLSIPSHNISEYEPTGYKEHYKDNINISIPTQHHTHNVHPYSYPSPRISPQFNMSHHQPPLPLNSQFLPLPYSIPAPMTQMTHSQDPHHTNFNQCQISPLSSPRSMAMSSIPSIPINHPMTIPPHPIPMYSSFKYPTSTCSNVQISDININPIQNPSQSTVDIMSESASTNSSNSSHSYSNHNNEDIPMLPPNIPSSNAFGFPSEYPETRTGSNEPDHTLFDVDDITATKIKEDIDAGFIPPHTIDAPFSDFDDDHTFIDQKPELFDLPSNTNTIDVTRTVSINNEVKPVQSRRKKIKLDTEGMAMEFNDNDINTKRSTKKPKPKRKSKAKSKSTSNSSNGSNTKKKIHICPAPDCNKEFKYKSHLERHMASHSKSKPYKCPTCKKSFGHQYYLQDHIRYNHIKDGKKDRKHVCSKCNKTFRLKINLTNHYRIHTGEKPFKCKNCNKAFTQKGNCDAHYRACIGIKPFKCNVCGKTFTRKMYLQQHERTHTGVKPFKCDICEKAFAIKSNMVKHKRARHKNEI